MPGLAARKLRLAAATAAVSLVVLLVSSVVPLTLPARWRDMSWSSSNGGAEVYTEADDAPATALTYAFAFEPVGYVLHRATRLTVSITDASGRDPDFSAFNRSRSAAFERIRIQFTKVCGDLDMPEMAGSFDAAWDAPGHTTVFEYPRRRAAWLLAWIAAVGVFFSLPGATVSAAACLWLLPQRSYVRRMAKQGRCGRCGYSLAGLTGDRCPECGSVQSEL
jgi:hypothetical protein